MKHLNHLKSGAAALALLIAAPALAEDFNIPAGDLAGALDLYASRTGVQLIYADKAVRGIQTKGVHGELAPDAALTRLLSGTGFTPHRRPTGSIAIVEGQDSAIDQPMVLAQAAPARAPMVETVTVTSSKLGTTDVQSIPIAITELSAEQLTAQKIEGGPDLLKSVPNMTFTKTNFSGYNVQIRGVGTQAISATTDPGVQVSFNDVGLIHNRLFEQEFFDVQSVEVLRGPQGTLYGRNATGGVINVVSAKPKLDRFEGMIKGEVGNYDSKRLVGMLNVPILDDKLGVRLAGSLTKRDGYDYNSQTENRVNGRDLWSLRGTVGLQPTPWLHGDIVWERFRENDNRSRTGKQLCHRDAGPDMIGSTPVPVENPPVWDKNYQGIRQGLFSTGCKAGSLYDDDAFGTPNGLALNGVAGLAFLSAFFSPITQDRDGSRQQFFFIDPNTDPYGGMMQSRNLREISSIRDPRYRASADILEFNFDADLSPGLTLSSQTAYNWDDVYSFQDYNRFDTVPIINDTSGTFFNYTNTPSSYRNFAPGGFFCDPQIGCTNTLAIFDVSSSNSEQFSQEIRLRSDSNGPFKFSVGGNYTEYKVVDEYYVMSNLFTIMSAIQPFNRTGNLTQCMDEGFFGTEVAPYPIENGTFCPYIDPNPVESINGNGHNYFRSSNPYKLTSWALFGETYYDVSDDLKLTAGLRYTNDKKVFTVVPSQLLLAPNLGAGGFVNFGYPATGEIRQKWGEFTGRIGLDWKPDWSFTDDSLVYGFYSRGYKAGGANPPSPGFATDQQLIDGGFLTPQDVALYESFNFLPILELPAVNYSPTFKPEFVNAFEIGSKNTLLGGALTLNSSTFFYDYKNYQVSQIRDRTAVNENFDARMWGLEFESVFAVSERFHINANLGYLGTRIADGETSIDPMNRTAGNPDYVVTKPWLQLPSNCVVPAHVAEAFLQQSTGFNNYWAMCGGLRGPLGAFATIPDTATGTAYDPANYPELNGGAGINTDLGGNELPNSPHFTLNVGAEYTVPFADEWAATVRGDMYWQAQSWWRVYNLKPFDRLEPWTSVNFTVRVDGPDGLAIEAYVKNAFDNTAITGAFLNSDDSGLTTNVFTTDPRLIGFSITKTF